MRSASIPNTQDGDGDDETSTSMPTDRMKIKNKNRFPDKSRIQMQQYHQQVETDGESRFNGCEESDSDDGSSSSDDDAIRVRGKPYPICFHYIRNGDYIPSRFILGCPSRGLCLSRWSQKLFLSGVMDNGWLRFVAKVWLFGTEWLPPFKRSRNRRNQLDCYSPDTHFLLHNIKY